jgi:hypothetical protein
MLVTTLGFGLLVVRLNLALAGCGGVLAGIALCALFVRGVAFSTGRACLQRCSARRFTSPSTIGRSGRGSLCGYKGLPVGVKAG